MRITEFSVGRPVFTIMLSLVVVLLGGISLWRLPIDLMPEVTLPTVSVSVSYENASPQEMEELVTRPLEQALSGAPGVEEITSTSSEGSSNVRVTFAWGTDLDGATADVRDRLDRVARQLPEEADLPLIRKFDLSAFPILMLGASSDLDPVEVREILENQVRYRLEQQEGVASIDIWGGLEREVHVNIDADRLKAVNIPLAQIINRLKAANITLPAGSIDQARHELTLRVPGQYENLDQIGQTVVAYRSGLPVRLKEVADIADSWKKIRRTARINGQSGMRIAVNKQSGTNTVQVAGAVRAEVERINRDMPQLKIISLNDSSEYIQQSISNVGSSALYGGVLSVLVLIVFLRNIGSTLVIATAIPISIVATFALMYFGDFTLNIMTLGGLALGVGMLVDNSIVVLENIFRVRHDGLSNRDAAINGTREVTGGIIASTLTTVAVFLPIVFIRGMSGVMFRQLAAVIGFALLCSLVVALTLVPMLSARLLGAAKTASRGGVTKRLKEAADNVFVSLEDGYKSLLHLALNHRLAVVLLACAMLGGAIWMMPLVGSELMPQTDEGEIFVSFEMEVGTRLEVLEKTVIRIEEIIKQAVPERLSLISSIGGNMWRSGGTHSCDMRIKLPPRSGRKLSSDEISADLRRRLGVVPGVALRVRSGQGLVSRILSRGGGGSERLSLEIRGYDFQTADALALQVQQIVSAVAGVTDVRISREGGSPEELILIDRHKAEDSGLDIERVAQTLQTALGGTTGGYFRQNGEEYGILVKLRSAEKLSLQEVLDLTVTNDQGQAIALRNIVATEPREGPVLIERKNQQRIVTVSAGTADRDMGSIVADIRAALAVLPMPAEFSVNFGSDVEEQEKSFQELAMSLGLALILVYMVMACQFESLRDPLVVMFSVPLAAIGVVLILLLTDTTFNVQSYIGCIMLGGIVVNNAILLVDHTNLLRKRDGLALRPAIEEAGRRRLRPILMTTFTTVLGLLPLALGAGEGGEAQAPLARAVIGGLASSSLITLLVVPVVYSLLEFKKPGHTAS
jgi:HAE1 family hydrophobic/amphiphilic exporter-1